MPEVADVANMALAHVGAAGRIANLEDDKSTEAQRLRQFWNSARDATLRDFDWNFARRYQLGATVQDQKPDRWLYAYAKPDNSVRIRRLEPEGYEAGYEHLRRPRSRELEVPFEIVSREDLAGELVCTNLENATIVYTVRVENATAWDASFAMAFGWNMGMLLVPSLAPATGRAQRLRDLAAGYAAALATAQSNSAGEGYSDINRQSDLIQAGY